MTRDFATLNEVAKLIDDPIGTYYQAYATNTYKDETIFYVQNIPDRFRARIVLSVAQTRRHSGDQSSALKLCLEAQKLAQKWRDPLTNYQCQKEIAIIQSIEGNHKGSFAFFEGASQIARYLGKYYPALWPNHVNSLAVELGELGQIEEALNASQFALASTFVSAYPEWPETRQELKLRGCRASRSFVATTKICREDNLVRLPVVSPGASFEPRNSEPGRVLRFREPVMTKKSKASPAKETSKVTSSEKLDLDAKKARIIKLILDADASEDAIKAVISQTTPYLKKKKTIELVLDSEMKEETVDKILAQLLDPSAEKQI